MSGTLLIVLGAWGALVPLIGPYAHFAYKPDRPWVLTSGRIWLEIVPGAVVLIGGLVLLGSRLRPAAIFGASIAALAGVWFAIGRASAPLWTSPLPTQGSPVGGPLARAVEQISFFTGLGVVIVCIASVAIGRLSVVSSRDLKAAERAAGAGMPSVADGSAATSAPASADSATASRLTIPGRRVAGMSTAGASAGKGQADGATEPADTVGSRS